MKILKIFGIVVGIHVFALILIFANPGCSTLSKTATKPAGTVAPTAATAAVSLPTSLALNYGSATEASAATDTSPVMVAPITFNPDVPASTAAVRYSPTRPNTPAASTLQTVPVADVIPASTYTVTKGDSLWSVAKKNHLSVAELAGANNLSAGTTLRLGQKLIIPGKSGAVAVAAEVAPATLPEAPAPKPTGESITHVVKPGETLGGIARKYQVSVGEIATANNITDPAKIRPCRELAIPGWKSPAVKAAAVAPTEKTVGPSPAAPVFTLPPPGQDLDKGFKSTGDAPVIKVEEASPFSSN